MSDLLTHYGADPNTASACLSADEVYRYTLSRTWDGSAPRLAWIMLNPSSADATSNDPTIRRCISFAAGWGYGGIVVVNLFALRSTDPTALGTHPEPVGPDNDAILRTLVELGGLRDFAAAWGANPHAVQRGAAVTQMLTAAGANIWCLGLTKSEQPRHPLYVLGARQLEPFVARAA